MLLPVFSTCLETLPCTGFMPKLLPHRLILPTTLLDLFIHVQIPKESELTYSVKNLLTIIGNTFSWLRDIFSGLTSR